MISATSRKAIHMSFKNFSESHPTPGPNAQNDKSKTSHESDTDKKPVSGPPTNPATEPPPGS